MYHDCWWYAGGWWKYSNSKVRGTVASAENVMWISSTGSSSGSSSGSRSRSRSHSSSGNSRLVIAVAVPGLFCGRTCDSHCGISSSGTTENGTVHNSSGSSRAYL